MTLEVSAANKSSAKIPGLLALCKPYKKINIHFLKSNRCSNKFSCAKFSPVGGNSIVISFATDTQYRYM